MELSANTKPSKAATLELKIEELREECRVAYDKLNNANGSIAQLQNLTFEIDRKVSQTASEVVNAVSSLLPQFGHKDEIQAH